MGAGQGLQGAKVLERSSEPANHALAEICDSLSILDMESEDGQA
jgi:hypothetical protein